MKRNWDTIRDILIKLEEKGNDKPYLSLNDFSTETHANISYHIEILEESGIIKCNISKTMGNNINDFFALRLTWAGHELLDSIRNENIWNKTKNKFKTKGLDMTYDLVKSVALKLTTELLQN